MLDNVIAYLNEQDVRFVTNEEDNSIRFSSTTKNALFECLVEWNEKLRVLLLYSIFAAIVPEKKRPFMAEIITRINSGIIYGNYEMDFSDGEIRYKTSADLEGVDYQPKVMNNLFNANLVISNAYFPLLIEALVTELSSEELWIKFNIARKEQKLINN